MRPYSIISVVNNSYIKFAQVFIKSALENLNLNNIKEICLLDTGIDKKEKEELLALSNKVTIVKADTKYDSAESWDDGWQENVLLKTNFAQKYLKENNIATCMVDIDSMFVEDIYDVVNREVDIILCDRSELWGGMPLIASFVGFIHPQQSIKFIDEWREKMKTMLDKGFQTRETPALNELVRENKLYKLAAASHRAVGLYKDGLETNETRILHFKGAGDSEGKPMPEAINIRLNRFSKYKDQIKRYLEDV